MTSADLILFDPQDRTDLLPLVYTRAVAEVRVGILTIQEKWGRRLGGKPGLLTQPYLGRNVRGKGPGLTLYVNGGLLPDEDLIKLISSSQPETLYVDSTGSPMVFRTRKDIPSLSDLYKIMSEAGKPMPLSNSKVLRVRYPWDIFRLNGEEIQRDIRLMHLIPNGEEFIGNVRIDSPENVYVGAGAKLRHCILNASEGPIYIGKNAEVMEGSVIRGPFALCEGAAVKMAAKIYGDTTVGPYSKVGGEITNSVIFGYSNKGHDGFLGNSVIGEWCNLGADTNTSNLKNDYGEVKVWNYTRETFIPTGLQFCGLIMGDHSKAGINTMFNTGTVVGVSCNVFGSGFPRKFIPSFSWGGYSGFQPYRPDKALAVAERVMVRRGRHLTEEDRLVFEHIFRESEKYR